MKLNTKSKMNCERPPNETSVQVQSSLFNDDQTSNPPSIYEKCREVKHTEEMSKWEGKRNREQWIRGEREKQRWLRLEMAWV